MSQMGEQLKLLIPAETQDKIGSLFDMVDADREFEFIFFSKQGKRMNREKYILLLKYIRSVSKTKNLHMTPPTKTLDVVLTGSNNDVYRITINDRYIAHTVQQLVKKDKNYMIYRFLYNMMLRNPDQFNFLRKQKEEGNTVDVDDLQLRCRLSTEQDLMEIIRSKNPRERLTDPILQKILFADRLTIREELDMNKKIIFRLKERTSLIMEGTGVDGSHLIRIDLTDTKMTNRLKTLNQSYSNYELELEYTADKKNWSATHLDHMYAVVESLLKLVQQSSFLITLDREKLVIDYYRQQLGLASDTSGLYSRQVVSLEIQHATEILPNRYCVTDKTDGEYYQMIIMNNQVMLIDQNMKVRDSGIVLDDRHTKYNGTIMCGEYCFVQAKGRHLFMVFDCLRIGDRDIRRTTRYMDRIKEAEKVIEECFIFEGQRGFDYQEMTEQKDGFNSAKVRDFYGSEVKRFYDHLNHDIDYMKRLPLIRRKFMMPVFGVNKWEIFEYSVEYWKRYTKDNTIKFPYLLDGLIYEPLEQHYTSSPQEAKYFEYKWKPTNKNSIDFYIEFKRDRMTNEIMDIYDNSNEEDVPNQPYRICTLFVGKSIGGREQPVPFTENSDNPFAYIYLRDGELRDSSGDIISDQTVVEFYYQNDITIHPQRRWVPIKTRYDKTEAVEKYGKKYGNYSTTASYIWRSIINPVLMEDFDELAKGNTEKRNHYDIKIRDMNSRISHTMIIQANKENKYYQKQTKLAEVMRQFHNFIKSNLIYTYCNVMYQSNTQQSVLDIACGVGGDISKFYYTKVANYVGVDIDAEGIRSPVNGAISRYNRARKKKPNYPKMTFIQADCRALLRYEDQLKVLSGMDNQNKKLLERLFNESGKPQQFDRINCQFAVHYFLENRIVWENFKQNLNNHLRDDGYFICSAFDAQRLIEMIGEKENYAVHYDNAKGENLMLFDIRRKYGELVRTKSGTIDCGNAIDLFATWMFDDGNYVTEYLVDVEFMKEELLRDCQLELVDTDLFENQLKIHEQFLKNVSPFESVQDTRSYLSKVAKYYEKNDLNMKCMEYTNLTRYMVFRKRASNRSSGSAAGPSGKKNKMKRSASRGGASKETADLSNDADLSEFNFSDPDKYRIARMAGAQYDSDNTFLNSVHRVLSLHKLIPQMLSVSDFTKDMKISLREDQFVDKEYIADISKNIVITHEIFDKRQKRTRQLNILDGLNIFCVERDCNNMYDIEGTVKNKYKDSDRAILLMREGLLYKPILQKDDMGTKGLFKMNDRLVKYLMENGDLTEYL